MRYLAISMLALMAASCESDNQHFCARYHYVYDQLLEEGNPSNSEMKQQLQLNLSDPKKDHNQARFMVFVLEDWRSEYKPEGEDSRDFCMRVKRWEQYP